MAENLLDLAGREIGSSGIGALSGALGLSADKGESALNTGLSTVLAGLLNKGSSKTGMGNLFNAVTGGGHPDLSSLSDVFSDPQKMSSLQDTGAGLLDGIFGSKTASVGNMLTSAIGGGSGSGLGLLKVAAPVVLSLLGKVVKNKGLDVSGLASLLLGQKPFIKDKLPAGLMRELGVGDFDKLGETVASRGHEQPQEPRAQAVHRSEKKRGGYGKWLWPLLIALAVLYALSMCAKRDKVPEQDTGGVIIEEEETVTTEPQLGFADSLREYLASATRDPNREFPLTIEFTQGSDQLTSTSVPDVDALVKIMQEFPNLIIAIEGHTSSEGDETQNLQLSRQRAEAVRQMLVDEGVSAGRVTASGLGSSDPIADNSTEEGRKRNRRIAVRVVSFD